MNSLSLKNAVCIMYSKAADCKINIIIITIS